MPLSPSTRLGPYEILSPLGAGGMGEVYRAKDLRLNREVAIKVLPTAFSRDSERLRRFEQEAQAAGALNHPNILAVYDVGTHDGMFFVVSELLEGETLRKRLTESPIPVRKGIEYAMQVARGLAAAHAKGIVHRDLKPENLFVTNDGQIKILDFGLAKMTTAKAAGATGVATEAMGTQPGVVMGTVGYMSPEQVRGQVADGRSDIFSLGVILYEMLSGKRAFQGESSVETMNAILKDDPPELPAIYPPALDRIIRRSMEKKPEERFQSVQDVAFALETISGSSEQRNQWPPGAPVQRVSDAAERRRLPVRFLAGVAAGALLAAGVYQLLRHSETTEPPSVRYLTYSGHDSSPDVSPDGRTVAFTSDRDGRQRIWLKQLPTASEAPLTEGPDDFARFSPDGSMILFLRNDGVATSLYRAGLVAPEPRKLLADVSYADWSPDGKQIVFVRQVNDRAQVSSVVGIVEADGGNSREIARTKGEALMYPRWSPDGRTIAAIPNLVQAGSVQYVVVIDASSGAIRHIDVPKSGFGISSVSWSGAGDEFVYAVAESAAGGLSGNSGSSAWIIAQNVKTGASRRIFWSPYGAGVFNIAGPGRLVFDTRSPRENLREFRIGKPGGSPLDRWLTRGNSNDRQPAYSPDGERVIFSSNRSGNLDLWELSTRSGMLRRVTDDPADDWDPAYVPDGKRIIWSSSRSGNLEIWMANADGTGARRITHDEVDAENPTATPDGNWILYCSANPAKMGVWKIRPDGSQASRLVAGYTLLPETSPDGRFVSFVKNILRDSQTLCVMRVADGSAEPFEVRLPIRNANTGGSVGRSRWMPDGRGIAFIGQNENGIDGIFVQEFVPGKDTSATRRPLCCFDQEDAAESFGMSPHGSSMTVAMWEKVFSLVSAERVPGVLPPVRTVAAR
jgi:eukaryotic-like serine/threonine-protein kinase